MSFVDPLFLYVFFPLVYAACLAQNERIRSKKWTLLLASILFYWWSEPLFVPVMLLTSLLDYGLSLRIRREASQRARRAWVAVGVIANLAVLCLYKYGDFIIANFDALLSPFTAARIPLLRIALPIGVSFVIFERITYLVDVFRRISEPASSFSEYCLFVFFFFRSCWPDQSSNTTRCGTKSRVRQRFSLTISPLDSCAFRAALRKSS